MDIVRLAIRNARLTLSILMFFVVAGSLAYVNIPKEAEPDVPIPIIYVSLSYQGISPEDSERLLLRPVETALKGLEGMKEMRSSAFEGGGFVLIEFQAGYDFSEAIEDVRAKVSDARRDLPQGADEPSVNEVNISEFPILVVTLSGSVPERVLTSAARDLRERIEEVPGVLEGTLQGARDELVEVIIDPMKLTSYGIQLDQLVSFINSSNSLVAAGALQGTEGRYAIKVPALIEDIEDVADLPIVASEDAVVRARDLATVRPTFTDAETLTRLDGHNAIAIEVKKRVGANLVDTVDAVKAVADEFVETLPQAVSVTYSQDKSVFIRDMLDELQNHVLIAVILVFIVVLYTLSGRSSLLIGLAVPASFLMGIFWLSVTGYTVNMIVLFSLILAVGMLVDDAIIVTEFAERRMTEGMPREQAFELAAKRMAGPVIAATMTRVAAFSPLLFWPGIVGEFMKYLPITLIVTLSASMLYALIFVPTLGAIFAKAHIQPERKRDGWYIRFVRHAVHYPKTVLLLAVGLLVGVMYAYGQYGKGVEFFPDVEPEYGLMYVHARGNLSLREMDLLARPAEEKLLGWPGIKSVYTRVGKTRGGGQDIDEDVIAVIQYEFADWRERKPASEILDDLRAEMAGMPGVEIEVRVPDAGPPTGQPIQIQLSANDPTNLADQSKIVAERIAQIDGVIDISNGLPPPGVDWAIKVDRAKAARYGVSPMGVGTVVQLLTTGVKLSEYRPAGVDDAVDIRLRLPEERRTLATLDQLRVETGQGPVPISNFVTREPERSSGILNRIDGRRTITVTANVASGYQVAAVQGEVISALRDMEPELGSTNWKLAGSSEESDAAASFLTNAFGAAIFLIFVVLLAQFNRFTSVWLVLMTVIMSTIGVFLGLLITGQTFGIVMSGIGVIALAGVVVNNNIVLIDTFDRLRDEGMNKYDAIIQTCRERARPVLLTAISAVLGVLPIAFGLGLELFSHEVTIGAPSTQWWISLSSAIVFGLSFATVLTLIVTPSALMVFSRDKQPASGRREKSFAFWRRLFRRRRSEDFGPEDEAEAFPKAAE